MFKYQFSYTFVILNVLFHRYLRLSTTFIQYRVLVTDRRVTFSNTTLIQALNGETAGGQFSCSLRNGQPIFAGVEYDVLNDFFNCSTINGGFTINSFATTVGLTNLYFLSGSNGACNVLYGPLVDSVDSSASLVPEPLSVGGRAFVRIGAPDCDIGTDCFVVPPTPGICDSTLDPASASVTFAPLPFSITDPDGIDNSNFVFSFLSGNEDRYFSINSATGALTLARALDRDVGPSNFTLIVQVSDGIFTDTFPIDIMLEDRNDNPPVPLQDPIVGSVDEGTAVQTEVATFSFIDLDEGLNAALMYIVSGADGNFAIPDSTIGQIVSQRVFDYDAGDRFFNFTVIAADGGSPSLIGSARVEITVNDLNDNRPSIAVQAIPGVAYVEDGEPVSPATVIVTDADSDSFPILYAVVRIYEAPNGDNEILSLNASLLSGFRIGYDNNTLVIVGAGSPELYSLLLSQVTYENVAVLFETPLNRTLIYGVCDQLVNDIILSLLSTDTQRALMSAGAIDPSLPLEDLETLISSCRELVVNSASFTLEETNDRPSLLNITIEFPPIGEDQAPETIMGSCVGDLFSAAVVDVDRDPFVGIAIVGHGSPATGRVDIPVDVGPCRSMHNEFRSRGNCPRQCALHNSLTCFTDRTRTDYIFLCYSGSVSTENFLYSDRCRGSGRGKRQTIPSDGIPTVPDFDEIVRAELYTGVGAPIDITRLFTVGEFSTRLESIQQQCSILSSNGSYYSFTLRNGSTVEIATPIFDFTSIEIANVSEASAILAGPLSFIHWIPTENQVGTAYFDYKAWDGSNRLISGATGIDTTDEGDTAFSLEIGRAIVEVTSVNDAPVIELGGPGQLNYSTTYVEGGPSVFVADRNAAVVEFDSGDLTLFDLRVRISALGGSCDLPNYIGASTDRLSYFNDTEMPLTYNMSVTGQACVEYTFEGEMSIDQWRAFITMIRFRVEDDEPSDHTRQISFVIRDSILDSTPSYTFIDLQLVSDICPVLTLPGSSPVTHAEHGGPTVLDGTIILTDADRDPLIRSATVAILANPTIRCGTCELSANTGSTGISASFNSTTLLLSLTGDASPEDYQQVLRTVAFEDTGPEPSFNLVDVRFSVFDPAVSPCTSAVGDLSVMAEHLNDNSPELYLDAGSQDYAATFTEGDSPVRVTGRDVLIMDADGVESDMYGILVVIEQGCISSEDRLEFPSGYTPTTVSDTYDVASCSLSLNGSRTALQTDLQWLRYRNMDIDNPTPTRRILNFTIFDGSLDSTFAQTVLDVVAVNDAPIIDLDIGNPVSSNSFVTLRRTSSVRISDPSGASIQDPDDTNLFGMVLTLSELDGNGNRVTPRSDAFFESIGSSNPNLSLSFGLVFSYNRDTGVARIAGTTSIANYVAVLNDLLYLNIRLPPTDNRRQISVQVTDGTDQSAMAIATIMFDGQFTPPELDLNDNQPGRNVQETYVITTPPLVLFPNTFLTDADGDHICSINVTLSGPDTTCFASSVNFDSAFSDITVDVNDVGGGEAGYVLSTSFTDCREAIVFQSVLRGVTFSTPDSASPGTCQILIVATDARGLVSNITTGTVEVRAFNAPPFIDLDLGLTGRDYSTIYFQGGRIQHIVSIFDPATARNITEMTVIGEADGEAPYDDGTIYHGVVIMEESNAGYTLIDMDSPTLDYLQVCVVLL